MDDDYESDGEGFYGGDDLDDFVDDDLDAPDFVEDEFGNNFKDSERAGGLGGVIGTKDSIYNQQEYNIKRIIDVATHEPFNMKITEERLNELKSIFNVKIRNPFMIVCVMKWAEEKYNSTEESLESFAKKYFGKHKQQLKMDFVRYLQIVKL